MYDKYEARNGETLESVAKKFGTSVDILKSINNIYFDDYLRAGMDIIIPKPTDQYFNYYVVEKGDSLYEIGRKYNIHPELLASMNGLEMDDYIYPNQEILIPKSGYSYYVTKDGDTLKTVETTFNTSEEDILKTNPVIYLLAGQILVNKKNK